MSFRQDGLSVKLDTTVMTINVEKTHRLVQLANALDWEGLATRAMPDLKKTTKSAEIAEVGIQCPGNVKPKGRTNETLARNLQERRAGIEPLIGHVKQMGLKRSRMKSDTTTLASGYRCVLGFNLRQLSNHQMKNLVKSA